MTHQPRRASRRHPHPSGQSPTSCAPRQSGRALAALVSFALFGTLAAACGADDEGDSAESAPAAATNPASSTVGEGSAPSGGDSSDPAQPLRIISLSPTATEMIFAIGAGDQLIAVDDQSNWPEEAVALQGAGLSGFEPNVEAVAALSPDLVLHDGTVAGFAESLDAAGIASWVGAAATSFDDIYTQIEQLGAATGQIAEAAEVVANMQADIDKIIAETPKLDEPLTFFHEIDNTLYSVTSNTFLGQMYAEFGLINIADTAEGGSDYPQLTSEFVVAADPDLIFLADFDYGETPEAVAARPGWSSITAVSSGGIVPVNADIASRWGPRVVDYMQVIATAIAAVPVAG